MTTGTDAGAGCDRARRVAALALGAILAVATAGVGSTAAWTGEVGDPAPALALTTLAGESVELTEQQGRAVLVNLWATYCLPCRHEMPLLDALAREHPEDLVILGISLDGDRAEPRVRALAEELAISYPILLDPEGAASRLFEAPALPASYLFDRSGRLVWKRLGIIVENDPDFAQGLERALDSGAGSQAEERQGSKTGGGLDEGREDPSDRP